MSPGPEKRRNFPFSTEKEILKHLKEESQDKHISSNALINNILTRYVTYYKYIEKKGKVVIPNKNFQFMLNNVEENALLESIKKNELEIYTLFVTKRIPFTFGNFIKYALDGAGIMGGLLHHYDIYKDEQDYNNLLLEHNYDVKWSKIIGNAYSSILKEMFHYNTQCDFYDHSVVIKILEKHILE
jgi:hypothetical protein